MTIPRPDAPPLRRVAEHAGPYATAATDYWSTGWRGALPLPPRKKKHPPTGYTGHHGVWPSYPDVYAWGEERPDANIGLRLPEDVIGIDVDDYDGKLGAASLTTREAQWGPLPPTVMSTSRDIGASGIRLYRVPVGLDWPGEVGPGIEVIHYGHRYVIAEPSIHPEGRTYRWRTTAGRILRQIPIPDQLPQLPTTWVTGLTGGAMRVNVAKADLDDEQVIGFLDTFLPGPACAAVARRQAEALTHLTAGGSRHEAMRDDMLALVGYGARGCLGAREALDLLQAAFMTVATSGTSARSRREASEEYLRALVGAVAIKAAVPHPDPGCRCGAPPVDPTAPTPPVTEQVATFLAQLAAFDRAVADETHRMRVREAAGKIIRHEQEGELVEPVLQRLDEFLAIEDDPAIYRIEGLWPVGGRVIVAAQYKAGKTTLVANIVRALVDGERFLGRFSVTPPTGRIVIFDDELDPRMMRRWLRDQGIINTDQVEVVSLRGCVGTFNLIDEECRARWVKKLREAGVSVIILDCLRPVLDAIGLSEDKDAGRFLVAFDALISEAGASEAMVTHHMGHSGERSRGDTRLRDWPDVEWTLVREKPEEGEEQAPDARRYFKAYGRDVDEAEGLLFYDEAGRALSLAGGSRKDTAVDEVLPDVLTYLATTPGASRNQIEVVLGSAHRRDLIRKAIQKGVSIGRIGTRSGPRNAILHHLASEVRTVEQLSTSPTSPTVPGEVVGVSSPDPLGDGEHSRPIRRSSEPQPAPANCPACGLPISADPINKGARYHVSCEPT